MSRVKVGDWVTLELSARRFFVVDVNDDGVLLDGGLFRRLPQEWLQKVAPLRPLDWKHGTQAWWRDMDEICAVWDYGVGLWRDIRGDAHSQASLPTTP